jgi:hypothetical protein
MQRIEQAQSQANPDSWNAEGPSEVAQHFANERIQFCFVELCHLIPPN